MEQGPTFAIRQPKYPTQDPNYRILQKQRNRYTHYYFYILDPGGVARAGAGANRAESFRAGAPRMG
ncbi:MAG: hypothetical protein M1608_17870 [Candidatus Omnitrophica bacterium]|nr:hypothetical protein [Candidatus Omnitrophota bacterium]